MAFAKIILPLNLKGAFTYRIPENFAEIQPGMRVLIPFGGKKIYTGLVLEIFEEFTETFVPKEIISVLDEEYLVPETQLRFWQWLSDYYLANIGEIFRFALPASLKLESETYLKMVPNAVIDYEILDSNETFLLQALEVKSVLKLSEIEAFVPKKEVVKTINSLIDLKLIAVDEKITENYRSKEIAYIRLKNKSLISETIPQILVSLKRSPKQQELLLSLLQNETEFPDELIKKSDFIGKDKFAPNHLKSLIEKDLVEEFYQKTDRNNFYDGEADEVETLTEIQEKALISVQKSFAENKPALLHGVTSSGKTHIYLKLIEECIAKNKTVLFLLPEISLTKQIIQRLEKKFPKKIGYYHPKLSDFERVEIWKKIRKNDLSIIISTRSGLFLPMENLGLIVVDEEHDSAYKAREVSPFFSARDSALVYAKICGADIILGSATPSVESYFLAKKEKLSYIPLNERFGGVNLPKFELINFRKEQESKLTEGDFSFQLVNILTENLRDKNQSMVLHNRRGYANVVECTSCGYVNYCSNCDVVMTYHKQANEMKCHYCGQRASKPVFCPKCHTENLRDRGVGVEQIYEQILKLIPDAEVARMDADSMRGKFAFEKIYEKIENKEVDIIVGTQMIAKGLDFDDIEVATIPKADQMLHIQDFRAEERAFQIITQLAGRTGRKSGNGRVVIQTFQPEHPVFSLIAEEKQDEVYQYFLEERKKYNYPPFTKLIMLEMKHRKEDKLHRAASFLGSILRKYLPEQCIFGPEKAPIARLNLLYQYQILLKLPAGKKYNEFKEKVKDSLDEFAEIPAYKSVKLNIFVDF